MRSGTCGHVRGRCGGRAGPLVDIVCRRAPDGEAHPAEMSRYRTLSSPEPGTRTPPLRRQAGG